MRVVPKTIVTMLSTRTWCLRPQSETIRLMVRGVCVCGGGGGGGGGGGERRRLHTYRYVT